MKNIYSRLFLILFLIPVLWAISCQNGPVSVSDRSREALIVLPDTEYGPQIYVALVQLEMLVPQNPKQHISDALAAIDAAGRKGVDLIVLPEGINIGSGGKIPYHQAAEPVDSPLLLQIASKSKKHNCFIVFPFIERDGDRVYNSAVLFDRNGDQLGVYRKMHEPQCVVLKEKVSLGQNLTVFDIDIGRIGILICYDTITPEPALIYGLQGVDLIVYPHMIQPLDNDYFSITTRARAIDSSLYIAAAGWARPFEPAGGELAATCLVDWEGKILAQGSKTDPGIVYQKVRLRRPRITQGLGVEEKAEWRKLWWGERRPHLYKILTKENEEWRAWCPSPEK